VAALSKATARHGVSGIVSAMAMGAIQLVIVTVTVTAIAKSALLGMVLAVTGVTVITSGTGVTSIATTPEIGAKTTTALGRVLDS
jgi:hypothetical protein